MPVVETTVFTGRYRPFTASDNARLRASVREPEDVAGYPPMGQVFIHAFSEFQNTDRNRRQMRHIIGLPEIGTAVMRLVQLDCALVVKNRPVGGAIPDDRIDVNPAFRIRPSGGIGPVWSQSIHNRDGSAGALPEPWIGVEGTTPQQSGIDIAYHWEVSHDETGYQRVSNIGQLVVDSPLVDYFTTFTQGSTLLVWNTWVQVYYWPHTVQFAASSRYWDLVTRR